MPMSTVKMQHTQLTQEPMRSPTNTHRKHIQRLEWCVTTHLPEPPASHDKHECGMPCQNIFPIASEATGIRSSISHTTCGVTKQRQSFSSTLTLIAARSMGNGSRFSCSVSCCASTCRDVPVCTTTCYRLPLFKFTQQVKLTVFFSSFVSQNSSFGGILLLLLLLVMCVCEWVRVKKKGTRKYVG